MTVALIMAGGRSERMRRSGNPCHKALRQVHGVCLLERNIQYAIGSGIDRIFVATNRNEPSIISFVQQRARSIAKEQGADVFCLLEDEPLGTIGIAQQLAHLRESVVALNVDNLTTIDLEQMIAMRDANDASLCIATHVEGFQVPLGQVVSRQGQIVEYREKPTMRVRVSSGAYVLAPRVCDWIQPGRKTDLPELIPMAHSRGEQVASYEHEAPWIDINDADALVRAETLIEQSMSKVVRPR